MTVAELGEGVDPAEGLPSPCPTSRFSLKPRPLESRHQNTLFNVKKQVASGLDPPLDLWNNMK